MNNTDRFIFINKKEILMFKRKLFLINFFIFILLFSCVKQIFIPEFNTPKEQYEFAKSEKDGSLIIVDKKKRIEKYDNIILAFKKVIEKFPDDKDYTPLAYISIGDCYRLIDQFQKAADNYEKAFELYGDMEEIKPFALYGAAVSYDHLKDFEKAQHYFKIILDNYENTEKRELRDLVKKARDTYSKIKVK